MNSISEARLAQHHNDLLPASLFTKFISASDRRACTFSGFDEAFLGCNLLRSCMKLFRRARLLCLSPLRQLTGEVQMLFACSYLASPAVLASPCALVAAACSLAACLVASACCALSSPCKRASTIWLALVTVAWQFCWSTSGCMLHTSSAQIIAVASHKLNIALVHSWFGHCFNHLATVGCKSWRCARRPCRTSQMPVPQLAGTWASECSVAANSISLLRDALHSACHTTQSQQPCIELALLPVLPFCCYQLATAMLSTDDMQLLSTAAMQLMRLTNPHWQGTI